MDERLFSHVTECWWYCISKGDSQHEMRQYTDTRIREFFFFGIKVVHKRLSLLRKQN
ncbi:hypothetical protein SCLCIDRAFT_1207931 [Scleroderma citrinum Foug A]|uniref:Fungal-type protein kinase domain-containing protein n=1 Tax=Scleroderma citrinum Foug A TaxID=1036808 RepID=A0A0C3E9Q7_9AGAM|nr:hypothetical protein SCLCIDRAFT_1207931 [Scleroderma citrinum Foug A]